MLEALIALAVLAAATAAALEWWRLRSARRTLEARADWLRAVHQDQGHLAERRMQWTQAQAFGETSVQSTTEAVRTIHRAIADIPFGILERIPVTRSTARLVRDLHDRTADGVYDTIGTVNRLVGRAARGGLRAGRMQAPVPMLPEAPAAAAPARNAPAVKPALAAPALVAPTVADGDGDAPQRPQRRG